MALRPAGIRETVGSSPTVGSGLDARLDGHSPPKLKGAVKDLKHAVKEATK